VPSYLAAYDRLKVKGVDTIACMSVNDAFVMGAWGRDQHAGGKVRMLADGNGEFAKAVGLELDASGFGMGKRSKRYAMIVNDGMVEHVLVDESGLKESSAESVLSKL
jgi:peroxiredoxin